MRISLTVVILLFISIQVAEAQTGTFDQHQEYVSFSSLGVYGGDVDPEYLFLVDNDFQKVLTNPSKTALYDKPFVATTLGNGANSSISTAVILPSKWFFSVSYLNRGDTQDRDANSSSRNTQGFSQNNIVVNEMTVQEVIERSRFDDVFNSSEIRVVRTWQNTNDINRGLGIFFGYNNSHTTDRGLSNVYNGNSSERYEDGTLVEGQVYTYRNYRDTHIKRKGNLFQGGLEYYSSAANGESFHKLYVEYSDVHDINAMDFTFTDTTILIDYENSAIATQTRERIDNDILDAMVAPLGFKYDGYINRKVDWLGDDYFFLSMRGRYSFGDMTLGVRNIEIVNTIQNQNNEDTNVINDVDYSKGGFESSLIFARISPGYALEISEDDYKIFTGLNPFVNYIKLNDYSIFSNQSIRENQITRTEVGFDLPLYGSFKATDWLKIWGGGNIRYLYFDNDNQSVQKEQVGPNSSDPGPLRYNRVLVNTDHQLSKFGYMGATFSHESGIKLNANFRGYLSRVPVWTISIGYQF